MKKKSAGELSRTVSKQWSKSEKREKAARMISDMKKKAHQINKQFETNRKLSLD